MGLSRGFTLLETAIVVAIIGIAAAIAVPRYAGAMWRYRAELSAQRLANDLALARAVARRTSGTISVSFTGSTYQINGLNSLDNPSQPWQVDMASDPYRATITSVLSNATPVGSVEFSGFGTAVAPYRIQLSAGGVQRRVDVADTGVIRVSSP